MCRIPSLGPLIIKDIEVLGDEAMTGVTNNLIVEYSTYIILATYRLNIIT